MKTIGAVAKKEFLNIQISNPYAFILSRLAISLSTIVITKCFSLFFSNQGDKSFQYVTAGVISYNISLSIIMAIGRSLMNERKFQTFSGLTLANVKYEQYFIGVFFGNLPYISIETFILLISSKALGLKLLLSNVSVFYTHPNDRHSRLQFRNFDGSINAFYERQCLRETFQIFEVFIHHLCFHEMKE